jgi:hypothetical protein
MIARLASSVVPSFYCIFFTSFDPVVVIHAAITDFLDQGHAMSSLVPRELCNEAGVNSNYNLI